MRGGIIPKGIQGQRAGLSFSFLTLKETPGFLGLLFSVQRREESEPWGEGRRCSQSSSHATTPVCSGSCCLLSLKSLSVCSKPEGKRREPSQPE